MEKENIDAHSTLVPNSIKLSTERQRRAQEIRREGTQTRGQHLYLKFLEGNKITLREAVYAYCYDCQGWYADGKAACTDPLCPLFAWAPFTHAKKAVVISDTPSKSKGFGSKSDAPDGLDVPKSGDPQDTRGAGV